MPARNAASSPKSPSAPTTRRARQGRPAPDEGALFRRAFAAYERRCRRAGGQPLAPSRPSCGFAHGGVYELRNTYGVLATFRYDAARDRLTQVEAAS